MRDVEALLAPGIAGGSIKAKSQSLSNTYPILGELGGRIIRPSAVAAPPSPSNGRLSDALVCLAAANY